MTGQEPALPDSFEVRAAHAIGAAVRDAAQTGDFTRVQQLSRHLLAEAPGETPEEHKELVETLFGATLFRFITETRDPDEKQFYTDMMLHVCSRGTIETVTTGGILTAGIQQGWLDARHYDMVAKNKHRIAPALWAQFQQVERRDAP
jgi:hypothetical protein